MIEIMTSIDLTGVKKLTIPEGIVKKISVDGIPVWEEIDETSDFRDLYQRVEYIQTVGSSEDGWFTTDIIADNKTGMEIMASFATLVDRPPMGSRKDGNDTRFYAPYPYLNTSGYDRICYGFNSATVKSNALDVDTIYRLQTNFCNSRYACIFDESGSRLYNYSLSGALTQQTCPIAIFTYLRGDTGNRGAIRQMTLYSAKISQSGEVIREYIPCYRKSDGVIGLWEMYTGEFLTTSSEGTGFEKGADTEWENALFIEPISTTDELLEGAVFSLRDNSDANDVDPSEIEEHSKLV